MEALLGEGLRKVIATSALLTCRMAPQDKKMSLRVVAIMRLRAPHRSPRSPWQPCGAPLPTYATIEMSLMPQRKRVYVPPPGKPQQRSKVRPCFACADGAELGRYSAGNLRPHHQVSRRVAQLTRSPRPQHGEFESLVYAGPGGAMPINLDTAGTSLHNMCAETGISLGMKRQPSPAVSPVSVLASRGGLRYGSLSTLAPLQALAATMQSPLWRYSGRAAAPTSFPMLPGAVVTPRTRSDTFLVRCGHDGGAYMQGLLRAAHGKVAVSIAAHTLPLRQPSADPPPACAARRARDCGAESA